MSFLRKIAFAAFLLASAFSVNSAQAAVVNVEPDFFATGTDISNSYPFVSLSVSPSSGSVYSVFGDSTFLGTNIARTGTHVFGWAFPVVTEPQWGGTGPSQNLLRADFSAPVNFVTIDFIFDDDDTGALRGYNSVGDLLVEYIVSGDGRTAPGFATAGIFRPQADIAYITAGSPLSGDALFLDNLVVNVVPIPAALPLFASALVVFGLVARQRKA